MYQYKFLTKQWATSMLETLSIENFAVAKKLSINFSKGLTAITGETGAGKSIAIDALSLILGGKTNAKFVRDGAKSCLICATFNISDTPEAKSYLCEKELLDNEYKLNKLLNLV